MRFFLLVVACFLFAAEIRPIKPVKYDKTKAKLGKMLFFDKSLSKNKDISCNSCHDLKNYGVDNRRYSLGTGGAVDKPMNSLSVYNTAYNIAYFWNGRAEDLEEQVIDSLTNPKEQGLELDEIVKIVNSNKNYVKLFRKI